MQLLSFVFLRSWLNLASGTGQLLTNFLWKMAKAREQNYGRICRWPMAYGLCGPSSLGHPDRQGLRWRDLRLFPSLLEPEWAKVEVTKGRRFKT